MLATLQGATNLEAFARALGYQPRGLAYILYRIPESLKYRVFSISKSSGGARVIHAPTAKLKSLQQCLGTALQTCVEERSKKKKPNSISHGFEKDKSIFTNAWEHKKRRYVLNIDLKDFFPSINFGRVRGYFINNNYFLLPEKAATLVAQIACYDKGLPQGSPCSPIIANLVASILDLRLARMAQKYKCTYTRYVDDITISTNQKEFPAAFAEELDGFPGSWVLSDELLSVISRAGFQVNHHKTRMQCRPSHQTVTGLTVNEKVNIQSKYYKKARVMCSSLFNHGTYFVEMAPAASTPLAKSANPILLPKWIKAKEPLEGILSYIYHIKNQQIIRSALKSPSKAKIKEKKKDSVAGYPTYRNLYKKFLYFKHFVDLDAPLIMCEGKTDNIYLRSALKALDPKFPLLAEVKKNKLFSKIKFLKHSRAEHDILELSGGSGNIANFIARYNAAIYNYKYRPLSFPIVVLVDNDTGPSGSGGIFSAVEKITKKKINLLSKDNFYYVCHNLYLVKTPELGMLGTSCMEDLFDAATKATKVGGKTFNPGNEKDSKTEYGKMIFADKVVRANYAKIDFSQFEIIFRRIESVLADYSVRRSKTIATGK